MKSDAPKVPKKIDRLKYLIFFRKWMTLSQKFSVSFGLPQIMSPVRWCPWDWRNWYMAFSDNAWVWLMSRARNLLNFPFCANRSSIYLKKLYFLVKSHFMQKIVTPGDKDWLFLSLFLKFILTWIELNWLPNVTINDISVIYVTARRCAGGLKKKLYLRSGSHAIDIS